MISDGIHIGARRGLAVGGAGGGGGAMPLGLANGIAWWDLSDAATLFEDTSATDAAEADDGIARVNDKSGNGNHLTQGTSDSRPLLKAAVRNGLSVARFDGTNDRLTAAGALIPADAICTIWLVINPTAEAVAGALISQYAVAQVGRLAWAANQNDGGIAASGRFNAFVNGAVNGAGLTGLADDFAYTSPSIITFANTGAEEGAKIYLGGVLQESFTLTSVYTGGAFSLGRDHLGALGGYDGDVYELGIFDGALSLADHNALGGYLATKWGMSWTTIT